MGWYELGGYFMQKDLVVDNVVDKKSKTELGWGQSHMVWHGMGKNTEFECEYGCGGEKLRSSG